jgi:hypothetical protein
MDEIEKIAERLEKENNKAAAANPLTKASLTTVKNFLKTEHVLCYGGTAINNLLPEKHRFYDPVYDIPDYDFYSKNPQEAALKLADKLVEQGIKNVEAKPGMHLGTFKVFADFEGVADITHLDPVIFDRLWKESIVKEGIHYVPPNFLRMSMYLELSRPRGDVSRWKKVFARLQFLNYFHPMKCPGVPKDKNDMSEEHRKEAEKLLKEYDMILLGITASQIHQQRKQPQWTTPVSVIAEKATIEAVTKGRKTESFKGNDILPDHTDILDEKGNVFMRLFETVACHSYHTAGEIKVASIPTALQFFLAFLYSDIEEDEITHILCVCQRLIDLADYKSKRRFNILTPTDCIGKQDTLLDMRKTKAVLYEKLSKDKSSPEFLRYFFTYNPNISKTQRNKVIQQLKKTRKSRIESSY